MREGSIFKGGSGTKYLKTQDNSSSYCICFMKGRLPPNLLKCAELKKMKFDSSCGVPTILSANPSVKYINVVASKKDICAETLK